ncbi:hypothetical protein EDD86DRAFT_254937 [Gorgonomyces haynaldii]|nr:hypothetical protein EDD86DRAFT_254937 [Gorgonomyces haynaldii]
MSLGNRVLVGFNDDNWASYTPGKDLTPDGDTITLLLDLILCYKAEEDSLVASVPKFRLSIHRHGTNESLDTSREISEVLAENPTKKFDIRVKPPAVQQPAPAQQPQPMDIDEKTGRPRGVIIDRNQAVQTPSEGQVQNMDQDSRCICYQVTIEPYNQAFQDYVQKARCILASGSEAPKVEKIGRRLLDLTSANVNAADKQPFVFLEGSSGMGKTQTAITVSQSLMAERPVFYMVMAKLGNSPQEIYKNFRYLSQEFMKVLELDNKRLHSENADFSPSVSNLLNEPMHSFGFLRDLLEKIPNGNVDMSAREEERKYKIEAPLIDGYVLKKEWKGKPKPVFVFDECINDEENVFRLFRNLFCSLGFGLLLLGTDSRVSNLEKSLAKSSRSGVTIFCHVYANLPVTIIDYFPEEAKSVMKNTTHLEQILKMSRPWFADLFCRLFTNPSQAASEVECNCLQALTGNGPLLEKYNALCHYMFLAVIDQKKIFDSESGKIGQLRLFHKAYYPIQMDASQLTLTHSHFAVLPFQIEHCNFTLKTDMAIVEIMNGHEVNAIWTASTVFPHTDEDLFLYLTMMGGETFTAFLLDNNPATYLRFLKNTRLETNQRQRDVDPSNANQASNDGMQLEATATALLCYCSHRNGLGGISLEQFLQELCRQLSHDRYSALVSGFGLPVNPVIPYLSPPNLPWPKILYDAGFNVADYERTSNDEMLDGRACKRFPKSTSSIPVLSMECKDYGNNVSGAVIAEVLKRIPSGSPIHFVFAPSYSDPTAFDAREQARLKRKDSYSIHRLRMVEKKFVLENYLEETAPDARRETRQSLERQAEGGYGQNAASADKIIIFIEVGDTIRTAWDQSLEVTYARSATRRYLKRGKGVFRHERTRKSEE